MAISKTVVLAAAIALTAGTGLGAAGRWRSPR
ncbi:hypothetical protein BKA25_002736 [Actinoalloteichus hymeniacidonis]|nr:hypothetical protein [Actinoalloteichus hymeniacidonis]